MRDGFDDGGEIRDGDVFLGGLVGEGVAGDEPLFPGNFFEAVGEYGGELEGWRDGAVDNGENLGGDDGMRDVVLGVHGGLGLPMVGEII